MTNASDKAIELFGQGFSCAQSVFGAFAGELGLEREVALKVASGFGGGMGRTGSACGAITGAIMAIGYANGAVDPADKDRKIANYVLVEKAIGMFTERCGQVDCSDLLGYELLSPPEQTEGAKARKFEICSKAVRVAAEIAAEILAG